LLIDLNFWKDVRGLWRWRLLVSTDLYGYDRRRGRVEIEFTWTDDVRQFYLVSPAVYRQLLAAKPMYLFLNRLGFEFDT